MVRLNNNIIEDFKSNFVSSDQIGTAIVILTALYTKDYSILDKLDDSNKDRKMILLYRDLVYKGYLIENEDNENSSNVLFSLTKKAIDLLGDKQENLSLEEALGIKKNEPFSIDELFKETIPEIVEEVIEDIPIDPSTLDKNDVEEWIRDWITLFPVKAVGHSYPLRTGKGVCASKMRMFLKNHPEITIQNIFDATKLYLEEEARRGWQYTTIAGNFISKAESGRGAIKNSLLETYCDKLLNKEDEDPNLGKFTDLEDNNPFL